MNNTNLSFHAGKDVLKHKKFMHLGFTLAEMMVVMLIMSIILAAMAPVMTTRARKMEEDRLSSTIWQWADNDTDIYFGYNPDELDVSNTQKVMIGQNTALGTDLARLVLNNSDDLPDYIRFNKDATTYGRLYMNDTSLTLGSGQGSGGGGQSTSIGIGALAENTGASNTAVGYNSLNLNTTGNNNTALGTLALEQNTTGMTNTGIGSSALRRNTEGNYNTSVGNGALSANTTGSYNTALGTIALRDNVEGEENTAIGYDALRLNTASYNTAVGSRALVFNETGAENVAIGHGSLRKSTNAWFNTAVGTNSMASLEKSGAGITDESGRINQWNTALGHGALYSLNATSAESGLGNTALGVSAMYGMVSGSYNTVIGLNAMQQVKTSASGNSQHNIAIGVDALKGGWTNTRSISNNIAIGNSALLIGGYSQSNIAIGHWTLQNYREAGWGTGSEYNGYNLMVGNSAGANLAIGHENVGIGISALSGLQYGSRNVALGNNACAYVTGSNKVCIGHNAGPAAGSSWASDDRERIFIGGRSKFNDGDAVLEVHNNDINWYEVGKDGSGRSAPETAVVVNGNLVVKGGIFFSAAQLGSNAQAYTGNADVAMLGFSDGTNDVRLTDGGRGYLTHFNERGAFKQPDRNSNVFFKSDRRLKYVGKEFTSGLDKIRQLKVFNYTFKKDEKKTPHVGVIAQDLQKVFPDAVKKGTDGFLQIRFEDMFYAVINAIKELDSRVTALEKENAELKKMLKQVQHDTTLQEARLKSLEAKLK